MKQIPHDLARRTIQALDDNCERFVGKSDKVFWSKRAQQAELMIRLLQGEAAYARSYLKE